MSFHIFNLLMSWKHKSACRAKSNPTLVFPQLAKLAAQLFEQSIVSTDFHKIWYILGFFSGYYILFYKSVCIFL